MSKQNLNSDYGYYNFLINNNTSKNIEASLEETRQMPVLMKMEDWLVSVVRFKIPSMAIPLMIFEDNNDGKLNPPAPAPPLPADLSEYWIGISLGDDSFALVENIVFNTNFADGINNYPYNRFLYYYTSFIEMINVKLQELWNRIITDTLGAYLIALDVAPSTVAYTGLDFPYFDLDNTTNRIKLYCPFNEDATHSCPFIPQLLRIGYLKLWCSPKLFYFLSGFPASNIGNNNVNINLMLNPNVLPGMIPNLKYYFQFNKIQLFSNIESLVKFNATLNARDKLVLWQDYSSLHLWNTFSRILLVTTMPVEGELIGVKGQNGHNYNQVVLTDFEIPVDKDGNVREYVFFTPTGVPRYHNFTSNGVLRKMDLRVYFQTKDLQDFPLMIPPTFEVSVKLQFKRRKAQDQLQYGSIGNTTGYF